MNLKKSLKRLCCSLTFSVVIAIVIVIGTPTLKASEELDADYKNMEQMMGAIRLEKKQVESMVDKLMASGRINPEEAAKAKRELASMNDNDLESLKNKAIAQVKDKRLLER
jgi:polyhydroxyalkanoate synthesis regulator phasin